ncbi:MAG: type II toxin-antitoxin system Phd/YefM family antitoxin [Thermoanaerobaculia bacterium]|jgi:prevent-host-death family protein|nr:type II toxin-antitoxin system Phd/YefM family antitoxin [Thermoanaerobaculia bacterium]MBP9825641.1 type II toxin-antitoxin system Phd/YefM family antitoxin [Thermoanaerobaculia bacterium]
MSDAVTVHEAKTHLSRLLHRVEGGESIVITRGGKPVARLVALDGEPRRPGRLKRKIRIARDFDAPLPAGMMAAFLGQGGEDGE